jgi:hypothetical protein
MGGLAVRVSDPHPESADFGPTLKYDLAAARRLCASSLSFKAKMPALQSGRSAWIEFG